MNDINHNIHEVLEIFNNFVDVKDTSDLNRVLAMIRQIESLDIGNYSADFLIQDSKLHEMFKTKWMPSNYMKELYLHPLMENTFGFSLINYYRKTQIKQMINPFELNRHDNIKSFVHARLRETHDLLHVLTGFKPNGEGEVALAAFCLQQHKTLSSAMIIFSALIENICKNKDISCYLSAILEGLKMGSQAKLIISFPIEDFLQHDLEQLRIHLGLV